MAKKKSIAEKAGEFELNLTPMIDAVFLYMSAGSRSTEIQ